MYLHRGRTFIASVLLMAGSGVATAQMHRSVAEKPATLSHEVFKKTVKAPQKVAESLVTNPQGTYKDYALSLFMYVNQLTPDWDEYDLKNKFVFSNDGKTVWIKDFFMNMQTGWVKGTLENDKITIASGQYVGDADGKKLYLFPFTINANNNPEVALTMNLVKKDGAWTMEGTNDVYWGLWYYTSNSQISLTNAYAHKQQFNEVTLKPTEIPSTATHEQYLMSFNDGWRGGEERKVVDVARDGNDIYISGLSFDSRSDYAKGTVNGNVAVFPSDQCVAGHDTYWLKLTGADGVMYKKKDNFTFNISNSGTMTLNDGVICTKYMFDGGNFNVASDVRLVKYAGDVPAVPAKPYALKYYQSATVGNQFTFVMPHKDVNGNELNPDKLYYQVYLDGKPYTFKKEKYTGLQEDLTMIPFNYYDSYNFNDIYQNKYKLFYLDDEPWSKMEIESIYIVDNVVNVSQERASVVNPASGINTIDNEDAQAVGVSYTTLTGQQVMRPLPGNVYLKTVTYRSGKKVTRKVAAE